jgi:hypothetical protein
MPGRAAGAERPTASTSRIHFVTAPFSFFPLSYLDFACSTERMKPPKPDTREPWNPPPQPLAGPGEQRPQHFQDEDEADAFSRWLAHVEAGRI